jgi:hypothetical protein
MKKVSWLIVLSIAVLIITFNHASAQDSSDSFKPSVKTFYWLQAGYLNDETENTHPTFNFKRARFGIKGKVLENVGYHLMVEGIHNGVDPQLYQAWIDYHLHPLANIRIGQFKYPFGLEAKPGFVFWKFIDPSFVTGGIVNNLGRINDGDENGLFRDIGAMISGNYKIKDEYTAGYEMMIFNGNGILQTDNNDAKDFAIRGTFGSAYGTQIGLTYYHGQFYSNNNSRNYDENAIGLEFAMEYEIAERLVRVQGEYIMANYETAGDDIKPRGYYIYSTYYIIAEMLELSARYSFFEPNSDAATTIERVKTTLGGTYYLGKYQLIRVNYDIVEDDVTNDDNLLEILFQITL